MKLAKTTESRAARFMVRRYGRTLAPLEAAGRADLCRDKGDELGAQAWRRIRMEINGLLEPAKPSS
jgi:hypothetical protein